ncbi:hypothetical protein NKR19_g5228 [Coniochaeta hoffmannii]|uniref:Uncharacterized protein n=1 Tax=Coniochaeta hoffmannii TaxID=91930 RepID=A0AA38RIT1_9PEZI|nr:hypothetical protein NKR19_g5228 [Coniochaeta hoffmannii]
MSTAKVLSTRATAVITQGSRVVQVGYVDRTDQWKRVHLNEEVQRKFKDATEQNLSSLRSDTEVVALQETPHKSERDNRTHFTAVELDGSGKVTAKRHFPVSA